MDIEGHPGSGVKNMIFQIFQIMPVNSTKPNCQQESTSNDDYCVEVIFCEGSESLDTNNFSGSEIVINLSNDPTSFDSSAPVIQPNFQKGTFRHNFDVVLAPVKTNLVLGAGTDPATERYNVMQGQKNGKVSEGDKLKLSYRVTRQFVLQVLLTEMQKLCFSTVSLNFLGSEVDCAQPTP